MHITLFGQVEDTIVKTNFTCHISSLPPSLSVLQSVGTMWFTWTKLQYNVLDTQAVPVIPVDYPEYLSLNGVKVFLFNHRPKFVMALLHHIVASS